MRNIVIFGAGGTGEKYLENILSKCEDRIICFLDNSKAKQGTKINGIDVFAPEKICELEYSVVVVVTSPSFENDIFLQLEKLGVDKSKILTPSLDLGGGGKF